MLLSPDSPFTSVLVRTDANDVAENWPTTPVLTFSDGTTWTAVTTTNEAAFSASSSAVNAILALADISVKLTVGGVLWARGSVMPV